MIARFSNGTPALLERPAGQGRVVLFASDIDRRWNDFPLHPAFVPFALETAALRAGDRHHDAATSPSPRLRRARAALRVSIGRPTTARSRSTSTPARARSTRCRPRTSRSMVQRRQTCHGPGSRAPGAADRVAPELLAVRPGADDCYTRCRIRCRSRVTPHERLRSFSRAVRRRWRVEAVLRAVGADVGAWRQPGSLRRPRSRPWFRSLDGAPSLLAVRRGLLALGAFVVTAWRLGGVPSDRQVARFVEERAAAHPKMRAIRRRAGQRRGCGSPVAASRRETFATSSLRRPSGASNHLVAAPS